VIGIDVSEEYVKRLNDRWLKSDEPFVEEMLSNSKNFIATTDIGEALNTDIAFVLVPTPSLPDGKYDHSFVDNALKELREKFWNMWSSGLADDGTFSIASVALKDIVIGCTTMPGYCDTVSWRDASQTSPELAENVRMPRNFRISYNPEFIAQGTIVKDQRQPDMILIGEADSFAGDIVEKIVLSIVDNPSQPNVHRMSRKEAEITKLALNCFLTTKIAYANSVGDAAIAAGVREDVILSAIGSDSRIGHKYLKYGFGFGGPCFPRDNRAFGIFAESVGIAPTISLATDKANEEHLENQVKFHKKIKDPLYTRFDYVTYKPESTLLTESQQLKFAQRLAAEGFKVVINERPSVIEELKKDPLNDKFTYNA
jgi:nucleotide sugar dehydrogenase